MPLAFRIIVGLCVAIELVLQATDLLGYPAIRGVVFALGGFFPDLLAGQRPIYPGQPIIMFVTYGFLHVGLLHVGMNMLALVQLVNGLHRVLTPRRMLLIYGVSQVAAGLLQATMAPSGPSMVGASGAVFGLAGAFLAMAFVNSRRRGVSLAPLLRAAALIAGLNIALPLLIPEIAWQAHVGGVLAGVIMGLWYSRPALRRRS